MRRAERVGRQRVFEKRRRNPGEKQVMLNDNTLGLKGANGTALAAAEEKREPGGASMAESGHPRRMRVYGVRNVQFKVPRALVQ